MQHIVILLEYLQREPRGFLKFVAYQNKFNIGVEKIPVK